MGKTLYDNFANARIVFEKADEILGFHLSKICFYGSYSELNRIEIMLPAIFVNSIAAFQVLKKDIGCEPTVCAGHSLGEYSALVCSNVLPFADALLLVRNRGIWVKELSDQMNGSMSVLEQIDGGVLESICHNSGTYEKQAQIACYNTLNQHVVSGIKEVVMQIEEKAVALGAKTMPVFDGLAFHCQMMKPVEKKIMNALQGIKLNPFLYPVYSNVTGRLYKNVSQVLDYLPAQVREPVLWYDITKAMELEEHIDLYVEVGSHRMLADLMKRRSSCAKILPAVKDTDLIYIEEELKSQSQESVLDGQYGEIVSLCFQYAVCIKNNNRNFLIEKEAIEFYHELYKTVINQIDGHMTLNAGHAVMALKMLAAIMTAKKIPFFERKQLIHEICSETSWNTDIQKAIQQELNY